MDDQSQRRRALLARRILGPEWAGVDLFDDAQVANRLLDQLRKDLPSNVKPVETDSAA